MKKLFTILLAVTMIFTLVACNNDTKEGTETKPEETPVTEVKEAEETEETEETTETVGENKLEQIKSTGKLIVGTSADYPPYDFHAIVDGEDKIVGFDMEFARAIAEEWGVELEIQDMDFAAVLAGVQTGMVDMGIAGINPNPERAQTMDFSDVYFESAYCILVREEDKDNYKTEEDLNGKAIGVQTGTVQEGFVTENVEAGNVVSLGKVTDLVMQLQSNMIDAIVIEVPVADSYAKNNEGIVAVPEVDFSDYGIEGGSVVVTAKGQTELVEAVNEIIAKLQSEGKFEQWYAEAVELADSQGIE